MHVTIDVAVPQEPGWRRAAPDPLPHAPAAGLPAAGGPPGWRRTDVDRPPAGASGRPPCSAAAIRQRVVGAGVPLGRTAGGRTVTTGCAAAPAAAAAGAAAGAPRQQPGLCVARLRAAWRGHPFSDAIHPWRRRRCLCGRRRRPGASPGDWAAAASPAVLERRSGAQLELRRRNYRRRRTLPCRGRPRLPPR